jgi:hypothetical protein
MGVELSILRRRAREVYDLGKPRFGVPDGLEPPSRTEMARFMPSTPNGRLFDDRMRSTNDAGFVALWSIMGTPNHSVFRLSAGDRDRIADLLHRGTDAATSAQRALEIAEDLIAWAGHDDLVLVPEADPGPVAHLGFDDDIEHYRRTGGVHRPGRNDEGDAN